MDLWGEDFNKLYLSLEAAGKGRKTVKAQHLWSRILEAQMETGTPYMLYKDHANRKSNQQNLGTIHCSNLCTEIWCWKAEELWNCFAFFWGVCFFVWVPGYLGAASGSRWKNPEEIIEYTSPDEVAVCNLASIALPSFANSEGHPYDFQKLYEAFFTRIKGFPKGFFVWMFDVGFVERWPKWWRRISTRHKRPEMGSYWWFACLLRWTMIFHVDFCVPQICFLIR